MKRPRRLLLPLLAFALAASSPAVPPGQKPAGKPSGKQAKQGGAGKKTSTRGRTVRRKAAAKNSLGQQQPEPERIRQIQQALAERGYEVEATGVWDAATVEALKRFQEDRNIRNLTGRGKLDPLTLIALGLGPQQSRAAPYAAQA
ncbi:MAG: peptidoglycan-binding domain-containing protein [Bryobacteraceae bacterium]